MDEIKRRATVHDVARQAGVSLATVDRVLNGRPGVRTETAEKVAEAIRTLDFSRDLSASLLARARDLGVTFLIPDGRNEFMFALGAAIQRRASASKGERVSITTRPRPRLRSGGAGWRYRGARPQDLRLRRGRRHRRRQGAPPPSTMRPDAALRW